MKLPNQICEEIKRYCLNNKTVEVCGFVVKKDGLISFIPVDNKHPDKENFFLISPEDYLKIKKQYVILFLFHSHPLDAPFSNFDLKYQKYHNINMLLYNVAADLFQEKCVNID